MIVVLSLFPWRKRADRSSRSIAAIMTRCLFYGALIAEIAASARRFFAQT